MEKLLLALLFIAMSISPVYAKTFTGVAPLALTIIVYGDPVEEDDYITTHEWDINGDGIFELNTGRKNWINYIFPVGTHIVGTKVTDSHGDSAFTNNSVIGLKPTPPTIKVYIDTCSICSTTGQ